MKRAQLHKHKLVIVVSAALVVLLAAIVTAMVLAAQRDDEDSYRQPDTVVNEAPTNIEETSPPEESDTTTPSTQEDDQADALDPNTVGTIDIQPMNITVSYVQGVGGFEYEVLRSPRGAQYVELRSPDLVGTKCTGDEGTFVSIIESPAADEMDTLEKTTEVEGTQYGLALSADTCTSEAELLDALQASFSDAFSLLKSIE